MKELQEIRQKLFNYLNNNDLTKENYERLAKALCLINDAINDMKEV